MSTTKLDNTYCSYKFAHETDLGTATVQNVTSGSATVYSIQANNVANTSTASYLKLYDTLPDGGIVTASTEPDYIFQLDGGKDVILSWPAGLFISTGLSIRCVADPQTNNVADPGQNVVVTVLYS
jgi:hypothetical protein